MGILDRIRDDQHKEFMKSMEIAADSERKEASEASLLNDIVENSLGKVANELEEDLEVIIPSKFYRLGDLVLQTQLYRQGATKPDASKPSLAIMEYAVSLIGVDLRTDRLDRYRVGSLKFLNYQKLYDAVTKIEVLDLHADEVLARRDQLDIFS